MVASAVGRPLYPDAFTAKRSRLDYARVCVVIDINAKLNDYIHILLPSENGDFNGSCRVNVEYEWQPTRCSKCNVFGHKNGECERVQVQQRTRAPVQVYVPKPKPNEWELVQKKKSKGVGENVREKGCKGAEIREIPESSNAFALLEHIDIEESDRVGVEEDRVRRDDRVRIGGVMIGDDDDANDLYDANELFRDVERECADLRGPIAAPGECVK